MVHKQEKISSLINFGPRKGCLVSLGYCQQFKLVFSGGGGENHSPGGVQTDGRYYRLGRKHNTMLIYVIYIYLYSPGTVCCRSSKFVGDYALDLVHVLYIIDK